MDSRRLAEPWWPRWTTTSNTDPEELHKLVEALDEHPDWDAVVATWPVQRSPMRDAGTRLYALADRIAWGTPRDFRHTAYRLMRRPTCLALVEHRTRTPVVGPLLHRVSSQVHNVEIEHGERIHGTSGLTVRDGLRRIVQNFASGSTAPLKALSALGLVLAAAAFIAGTALLLRWLFGADSPSGWLSVMLATIFVGGANLLAFGILGTYIDIIVREVRQPPRWSVRRTTSTLDAAISPEPVISDQILTGWLCTAHPPSRRPHHAHSQRPRAVGTGLATGNNCVIGDDVTIGDRRLDGAQLHHRRRRPSLADGVVVGHNCIVGERTARSAPAPR